MGELHLEVLVDRMKREFRVEANIGKPQVAYRETIRKRVEGIEYVHKKQTGGAGQFAKVKVNIEPLPQTADGPEYEFDNKVTGGRIPREYIPSVDAGAQDAMQFGMLASYPLSGSSWSWSTVSTTRSIRPRWPSRSPARWCSRTRQGKLVPRYLSQ